jgi:hypothetical protein
MIDNKCVQAAPQLLSAILLPQHEISIVATMALEAVHEIHAALSIQILVFLMEVAIFV